MNFTFFHSSLHIITHTNRMRSNKLSFSLSHSLLHSSYHFSLLLLLLLLPRHVKTLFPSPMSTFSSSSFTPLPLHNTQPNNKLPLRLSAVFTPILRSPTLPKLPLQIPNKPYDESTLFDQKLSLLHSHGVHLTSDDLRRISGMCPDFLPANPNLLTASISFLLSNLNLQPSDLSVLFKRRPRLLLSPVKTRLQPCLFFFMSLELNPVEDYASLLCFSVEDKFLPRLEFLQAELGFSHKEARSMARRFPQIFCYSIDNNLRPKSKYLLEEMKRDLLELRDFPDYFSFSLKDRIMPRHKICEDRGIRFTLPAMLRPGEKNFQLHIKKIVGSAPPVEISPLWRAGMDPEVDLKFRRQRRERRERRDRKERKNDSDSFCKDNSEVM